MTQTVARTLLLALVALAAASSMTGAPRTASAASDLDMIIAQLSNPRERDGSWVTDDANVIPDAQEREINAEIDALEAATSAEIAVVTVDSLQGYPIESYANRLFNTWGIGKRGRDNGVLILHATQERRVRFETGYGVEDVLPDTLCKHIQNEITVPYFKLGDFGTGHVKSVKALASFLQGAPANTMPVTPPSWWEQLWWGIQRAWAGGLFFPLGVFIFGLNALRLFFSDRIIEDPYRRYQQTRHLGAALLFLSGLCITIAVMFVAGPLEALGAVFITGTIGTSLQVISLRLTRNVTRKCAVCQKDMTRLSEVDDDEYLEEGQISEEHVGSIDYDVWVCPDGHPPRVEAYTQLTSATRCSVCQFKTEVKVGSTTIQAATYSSSGQGRNDYKCRHCGHKRSTYYTIARKTRSSSGGGSFGGGSSGGGSFGGGSSGGGGASSSY